MRNLQLAREAAGEQSGKQDSPGAGLAFKDALQLRIEPPWAATDEPRVVPRVLDGENASLSRGMVIVILLIAILISLVLGIAAAQAIVEAVT